MLSRLIAASQNFHWLVGLLLRAMWAALACLAGFCGILAVSTPFLGLLFGVGLFAVYLLFGLVIVAFPLSVVTYVWIPQADPSGFLSWLGKSRYGWFVAFLFFIGGNVILHVKPVRDITEALPLLVFIVSAMLFLPLFYARQAFRNVAAITSASQRPPYVAQPVFWLWIGLLLILVSAAVWYEHRDSLLVAAAQDGATNRVRLLLSIGADPNTAIKHETSLIAATKHGHPDIVRALLARGARVQQYDVYGRPPLVIAAQTGSADVCKVLLNAGADPNLGADAGDTPLIAAVRSGSSQVVQLLVIAGADVDHPGSYGERALSAAIKHHRLDIADTLVAAHANVNATDMGGRTALHYAAEQNDGNAIVRLLRLGADPTLHDHQGFTPAALAARSGNDYAVDLLAATFPDAR